MSRRQPASERPQSLLPLGVHPDRAQLRCIMASSWFSWVPYSAGNHFHGRQAALWRGSCGKNRGLLPTARFVPISEVGLPAPATPSGDHILPTSRLQPSRKSLSHNHEARLLSTVRHTHDEVISAHCLQPLGFALPGGSIGQSTILMHQGCRFSLWSGHMQEATVGAWME